VHLPFIPLVHQVAALNPLTHAGRCFRAAEPQDLAGGPHRGGFARLLPPGVVAAVSEEQDSSDHGDTTPEESSGPVGGYATRETENPVDQQHPAEQELEQSPGLHQVDVHGFSAVVWVGCGLTTHASAAGDKPRTLRIYASARASIYT
jgi:hypothetical protein